MLKEIFTTIKNRVTSWHYNKFVRPKVEAARRNQIKRDLKNDLDDLWRLNLIMTLSPDTYKEFVDFFNQNINGIKNYYGSMRTWFPESRTIFEYKGRLVDKNHKIIEGCKGKAELEYLSHRKRPFHVEFRNYRGTDIIAEEAYGFEDFDSALRYMLSKSV